MKYEYEGTFLNGFATYERSLVANQFCYAVRGGCATVDEIITEVGRDAQNRFATLGAPESQRKLLEVIDEPETRKFAEFILWRESLPPAEKLRLKETASKGFQSAWMAKQPPTKKQLSYLEGLACHVIPANRLEASQLIGKYKGGGASGDV